MAGGQVTMLPTVRSAPLPFLEGAPSMEQPELAVNFLTGKASKCRQKVCSSKRPPRLEARSVRSNDVLEYLCM